MPDGIRRGLGSLGTITVAAAATRQSILQNFTDLDTEAERLTNTLSGSLKVKSIFIQALGANAGLLYVGLPNIVGSTGVGVIAELSAGQSINIKIGDAGNCLQLETIFLDVATNGDKAYASYTQQ